MKRSKRDKWGILFLLIFIAACHSQSNKEDIVVSLEMVMSNYPIENVDTIAPLPQIYFVVSFKNKSEKDYHLRFPNKMSDNTDANAFYAKLNCPNGGQFNLPLYQNTSKPGRLKKGEELLLSFTPKFKALEEGFANCEKQYLGRLIELATQNIALVYQDSNLAFDRKCARKKFESPEYFMQE